jgi:predicted MFS family arabinose efflux permease
MILERQQNTLAGFMFDAKMTVRWDGEHRGSLARSFSPGHWPDSAQSRAPAAPHGSNRTDLVSIQACYSSGGTGMADEAVVPPYKVTLAFLVLASTVGKTIMIQNLAIDSLSALYLTDGTEGVSTFPATMMQVGNALGSIPAAVLMDRCGRRCGFLAGAVFFVVGASGGALALEVKSFALQLAAVFLTGVGIGFNEYLRFAAAEIVPPALKARAVSLTIASSVLSGIMGPQVAKATVGIMD